MTRFLITGCASGIGRHLARALATRGHLVVATDFDLDGLAKARADDAWPETIVSTFLDVTSEADWDAGLDLVKTRFGGLDVLLNVAGFLGPGFVEEVTTSDIERHLAVNVKGVILGTSRAGRLMIAARNRGHIVNFGSLASLTPVPGLSLYCASKWAVRGFTLSAAVELAEHHVAVTLVCPDAVETPMLDQQKNRKEAALTFSGARALTTSDIERALIDHVLPKRPLEITIPLGRGLLARLGGTAPAISSALYPLFRKKGLEGQRRSRGD